ncbi:MAG TPA: hypothetical protein VNJ52_09455, partial [Patescibacteria group bacterium]|nr:hypothetical protein [Patescibacteria group bacterium]
NVDTYPQVLQAAGKYLDVVEVWVEPKDVNTLADAYNIAGKPVIVWTTETSQEDTEIHGSKPWGGACNGNYDFCTQGERGRGYDHLIRAYWNSQSPQGTHFVLGIDWWAWSDQVTNGERMNFGLVDLHDHRYDGREAADSSGSRRCGECTKVAAGREQQDDFLAWVIRANQAIRLRLLTAAGGHISSSAMAKR